MVEGLDEPRDGDDEPSEEQLNELHDEAETLLSAAAALSSMSEVAADMDDEDRGLGPDELDDAEDVCRKLGTALTQMLSAYGYFDEGLDADEDDTFA